jgi:type I restriction enzyme M protein
MFVQSLKFIEAHKGNAKDVAIYGQELTPTTYKLAKMNLAIRGISANLGEAATDTFSKDQHKDLKADYILANPPFNLKDWRGPTELIDDPRWAGYDIPPVSNANYAWILHMISKLSSNGIAAFLLANGALGDPDTLGIRKKMIDNNLVEAILVLPRDMFYSTDISVTLWIINKNKNSKAGIQNGKSVQYRDRSEEILFMDLRRKGVEFEKKYVQITDQEIQDVAATYHAWQRDDMSRTYRDIPEFCFSASLDQVKANDYSLVPSKYIQFIDNDKNIDFANEMEKISKTYATLLNQEESIQEDLKKAFESLGYAIKP